MNLNVQQLYISVTQSKMQYVHCGLLASYFPFPWSYPAELSRRSILFITIKAVPTISNTCKYNFFYSMGKDWSDVNGSIYVFQM